MRSVPGISIVTPSFNQGQFIEETITSVLEQQYPNLEYIIIDGGSTDNSVEIIKKYEKHLKYWVSEKDNGQAHAINKGLQHCTGDIFNWLNSDDYLERGALIKIADAFSAGVTMVGGGVKIFNLQGTIETVKHQNLSSKGLMNWELGVKFVQPGVWLKRALVAGCGGIDESYHYSFDWDLYIRYLSKHPKVKYIDDLLVHFRYHDTSKTISSLDKFHDEELKIIEKLAVNTSDKPLQRIAKHSLVSKKLRAQLKEIVNTKEKNALKKIFEIAGKINIETLSHWRALGGALKKVLTRSTIL